MPAHPPLPVVAYPTRAEVMHPLVQMALNAVRGDPDPAVALSYAAIASRNLGSLAMQLLADRARAELKRGVGVAVVGEWAGYGERSGMRYLLKRYPARSTDAG